MIKSKMGLLEPATIRCRKCGEKSYIGKWKVGTSSSGVLIRVCPKCNHKEVIQ